jgi:CDGSH-type Zn-finger protein/uncharacterized Fe-S cluster protein YjdI
MSERKVYRYVGGEVDVDWDERLCIHIGECGQAQGELFVAGRQPWCVPDTTTRNEVRDIVERCPSGALSYVDKSGEPERAMSENAVAVSYNGPLFVCGELAIEGAPEDMPGVGFRAALCRCGQSCNKPFCDNSHHQAGFRDAAAVGESGTGPTGMGGALQIKPLRNGPLLLSGHVIISASSGRVAWQGDRVALCRCGESKNKPFCDGSHVAAGFKSD